MARLTNDVGGIGGNGLLKSMGLNDESKNLISDSHLLGTTSLNQPSSIFSESAEQNALYLNADGQKSLNLPSTEFVTDATMMKSGDDLHLVLPNGQRVVVENYFDQLDSPELIGNNSIILTPQLVDSFLLPETTGQYAQSIDGGAGDPIGTVEFLSGQAFAIRGDGTRVQLQLGDPVYQGDQIETNADGSIKMRFVDDTIFTLGEDARLALDELVYNPSETSGNSAFSILKGSFVFVSGQIAHDNYDNMQVNTPVATIGIRGTTVTGTVLVGDQLFTFSVLEGSIEISAGGETLTLTENFDTAVGERSDDGGLRMFEVPTNQDKVVQDNSSAIQALGEEDIKKLEQAIAQEIKEQTGEDVEIDIQAEIENVETPDTEETGNEEGEQPPEGEQTDTTTPEEETQEGTNTEGDSAENDGNENQPPPIETEPEDDNFQFELVEDNDLEDNLLEDTPTEDDTILTGANDGTGSDGIGTGGFVEDNSESSITDDEGDVSDDPEAGEPAPIAAVIDASNPTFTVSAASTQAYNVTGSAAADVISLGAGGDTITSGAGDDVVGGGAGDDTVVGGTGNGYDKYDGGSGSGDTLKYPSAGSSDHLTVTLGYGQIGVDSVSGHTTEFGSPVGTFGDNSSGDVFGFLTDNGAGVTDADVFTGFEILELGSGNDTITVNNSSHNTALTTSVDGASGTDSLIYESVSTLSFLANGTTGHATDGTYTQSLTNIDHISESGGFGAIFVNGQDNTNLGFDLYGNVNSGTLGAGSAYSDTYGGNSGTMNFTNLGTLELSAFTVDAGTIDSTNGQLELSFLSFEAGTKLKLGTDTNFGSSTDIHIGSLSTLDVDSGETLTLSSGHPLKFDDGATIELDGRIIVNESSVSGTTNIVTANGSGTLENTGAFLLGQLTSTVDIENDGTATITVGKSLQNNGNLLSADYNSDGGGKLKLEGTASVTGTGNVTIGNSSGAVGTLFFGDVFNTVDNFVTVFNNGILESDSGGGQLTLTNGGLISGGLADIDGATSRLVLTGDTVSVTNDGNISLSNGGALSITGGKFALTDGGILGSGSVSVSGAELELGSNSTLSTNLQLDFSSYSTLTIANGQSAEIGNAVAPVTFSNSNLNISGELQTGGTVALVNSTIDLSDSGTISINSNEFIVADSAGENTFVLNDSSLIQQNGTFNGTIQVDDEDFIQVDSGETLNFDSDFNILSHYDSGSGGTWNFNAEGQLYLDASHSGLDSADSITLSIGTLGHTYFNNGSETLTIDELGGTGDLTVKENAQVIIDSEEDSFGGTLSINSGTATNLELASFASLSLLQSAALDIQDGATLKLSSGSTLNFDGDLALSQSSTSTGDLSLKGGKLNQTSSGTLNANADIYVNANFASRIESDEVKISANNSVTFDSGGSGSLTVYGNLNNDGDIFVDGTLSLLSISGDLDNSGFISITTDFANALTVDGSFNNSGSIDLAADGNIENSSTFTNINSGLIKVGGSSTIDGTLSNSGGTLLTGESASIIFEDNVSALSGTLSLGNESSMDFYDTLTVSDSLTLNFGTNAELFASNLGISDGQTFTFSDADGTFGIDALSGQNAASMFSTGYNFSTFENLSNFHPGGAVPLGINDVNFIHSGGTFIIGDGFTVDGNGAFTFNGGAFSAFDSTTQFENTGGVIINSGNTIAATDLSGLDTDVTNSGTINLDISQTATSFGDASALPTLTNNGRLNIDDQGAGTATPLNFTYSTVVHAGVLHFATSASDISFSTGSTLVLTEEGSFSHASTASENISLNGGATLKVESGDTITINGANNNFGFNGSLTIDASVGSFVYESLSVDDDLILNGDGHKIAQDSTFTQTGSDHIQVNGQLINNGTLALGNTGSITLSDDSTYIANSYHDGSSLTTSYLDGTAANASINFGGDMHLYVDGSHSLTDPAWTIAEAGYSTGGFSEVLVLNSNGADIFSRTEGTATVVGHVYFDDTSNDSFKLQLVETTDSGSNDGSGNLTFTGTASDDIFLGGSGNDTADSGLGGSDIFFGGDGDDTFTLSTTSFDSNGTSAAGYYDGGSGGMDGLVIDTDSGLTFDDYQVNRIEVLDMTGAANNSSISTSKVLAMTEDTNAAITSEFGSSYASNALILYSSNPIKTVDVSSYSDTGTTMTATGWGDYNGSYSIYEHAATNSHIFVHSGVNTSGGIGDQA